MHMDGTIFAATCPMRLMPPIMTKAMNTASINPVAMCGMLKYVDRADAAWLA